MGFFCFIINQIVDIYIWIIIIAVLMTYFQPNRNNQIVQLIFRLTEPTFYYARKYLPFLIVQGMDFTPIAIIFVLQLIPRLICSIL